MLDFENHHSAGGTKEEDREEISRQVAKTAKEDKKNLFFSLRLGVFARTILLASNRAIRGSVLHRER
jgi:hypothetical protein